LPRITKWQLQPDRLQSLVDPNPSYFVMAKLPTYVLITPARNEAAFIEETIKSVVAQVVKPKRWVIVSDGSTDGTDDIVRKYAVANPWIELLRMPERRERHFAGKVFAFNTGYESVKSLDFDVLGSLDADISFDENYFSVLLQKMEEDPRLGLVGSAFRDTEGFSYDYRFVSIQHVTGCCMIFRRECYEQMGGYVASKGGAVDWIANISARMNGWATRSFTETSYLHHRPFGTAESGILKSRFKDGKKDHLIGSHPLWMLCRTGYQMTKKPFVLGGLSLFWGYSWSWMKGVPRPVSKELVKFHRHEQMARLKRYLSPSKADAHQTSVGAEKPEIKGQSHLSGGVQQ
jgi:poly-beta-1,6-N-acetyl-D-glucosamine synthase